MLEGGILGGSVALESIIVASAVDGNAKRGVFYSSGISNVVENLRSTDLLLDRLEAVELLASRDMGDRRLQRKRCICTRSRGRGRAFVVVVTEDLLEAGHELGRSLALMGHLRIDRGGRAWQDVAVAANVVIGVGTNGAVVALVDVVDFVVMTMTKRHGRQKASVTHHREGMDFVSCLYKCV